MCNILQGESAVSGCPTFALSKIRAFFKVTVNVREINKNQIWQLQPQMYGKNLPPPQKKKIGAVGYSAIYNYMGFRLIWYVLRLWDKVFNRHFDR